MKWAQEKKKKSPRASISIVQDDVKLKGGEYGRIQFPRGQIPQSSMKVSGRQVAREQEV